MTDPNYRTRVRIPHWGTYTSTFFIWASWLTVTIMKMNDGKRQNINWNWVIRISYTLYNLYKPAKIYREMSHTWNDQNLGCDIGENLLKHMAWQPGWLVSHRNTPLITCYVTVTWYESYRWRNNYLFVTIDLWSDHQDNKSAKDEINRPPRILLKICHLWRHKISYESLTSNETLASSTSAALSTMLLISLVPTFWK